MTSALSTNFKRAELRQRLLTQRLLLARQLYPVAPAVTDYPRSMTMRLLLSQPGLLFWVLTELAPPLLSYYLAARQERRNSMWLKAPAARSS